jgi:hypothetical protein
VDEIKKILQSSSEKAFKDIKVNVRKQKATGKTLNALFNRVTENSITMGGDGGLSWLETGRGPAKTNSPKFETQSLIDWMDAKGIGSSLNTKEKTRLANFFKYRINRFGTKKWQQGKGTIVDDVYTSRLQELTKEVNSELRNIRDILKIGYNGKNIVSNGINTK